MAYGDMVTQPTSFDDILDECLERLFSAEGTVEQCLEAYPEHAAELAPLLRTAVAARQAVSIEPNTDFKARARYQFLAEVDRRQSRLRWPRIGWQRRWAMAGLAALVIVVVGSGTVVAADSSMPGSALYPVKLATERVRLAMTFSDVGRAEYLARMIDRRVDEIDYTVARGRPEHVEQVTERLMKHLGRMSGLALAAETSPDRLGLEIAPRATRVIQADGGGTVAAAPAASGNGRARLKRVVEVYQRRHPARLREALDRASESSRPLLRRAIRASEESYHKVLEELRSTRPQDGGDEATDEPESTGGEPAETEDGTRFSPAKPR